MKVSPFVYGETFSSAKYCIILESDGFNRAV